MYDEIAPTRLREEQRHTFDRTSRNSRCVLMQHVGSWVMEEMKPERRRVVRPWRAPSYSPEMEGILDVVAGSFAVSKQEILGKGGNASVVRAREVVVYLARKLTRLTYPEISRRLGRRSYDYVLHVEDKMVGELDARPELQKQLDGMEKLATARLQALRDAWCREPLNELLS
jgi:hypothetical protein